MTSGSVNPLESLPASGENAEFQGAADDPRSEIRLGAAIAAFFFVGLLGWAALTPLDAAAHAEGRVAVQGNRQAVQHREGGIVSQLLVREGQVVRQGQILVSLAGAEVIAQEQALSAQAIQLLAQRARLEAEQAGLGEIARPAEFLVLFPNRAEEIQAALALQRQQLQSRMALVNTQQQVAAQRAAQSSRRGGGSVVQMEAAAEQLRLITQELESLRTLAERGFVSQTRIRSLERAQAELRGQIGRYRADSAEAQEASGESRLQGLETLRAYRDRGATELREVQASLNEILPRLQAARDQLARTQIRAPVSGTVVGLSVNTVGGVIEAGQRLMEIVPDQRRLLIEARISPDEADDVVSGQTARVRFPGLHDRDMPDLEGEVLHVSADSFADERTGQSYFTAQIAVSPEQFARLQGNREERLDFRSGMPATVLITLRPRTALEYAFEPLTNALWRSFGDH